MRNLAVAVAVVAIALLVAACGGEEHPSVRSWAAEWESARELVPDASEFAEDANARCGKLLGEVRAEREELQPTPNEQIDDAFDDWVAAVETFGLDCVHDAAAREEQLDEIDNLADLVELTIAGGD